MRSETELGHFLRLFLPTLGFSSRSDHILSFLLPLIQEGQLSVTGESLCTKHWLTALAV